MGVPAEKDRFAMYLEAFETGMKKFHDRGVIHMDLYPSNVMWNFENGAMILRFIDWDAATLKNENFTKEMQSRLQASEFHCCGETSSIASTNFDYWFLYILSHLNDEEREKMNGSVHNVNQVFCNSIVRQKDVSGGNEQILDSFVVWLAKRLQIK